jgi:hypothetical protein
MNKELKKYYWIFYFIFLILGVASLSLTIYLLREKEIFLTAILGIVTYWLLSDWWKIKINKWRLDK